MRVDPAGDAAVAKPRGSLVERITRPRFLALAGSCFFVVWVVAFVAHELSTPGLVSRQGIAVGRDFLGFYAAAEMVRRGEGRALYDPKRQVAIQAATLAPDVQRGHYYFINPAFWAVLNSPLARLPYRAAAYLHILAMAAAFFAGMWVLRRCLAAVGRGPGATLLALTWFPMMHTILGGQNAPLTFALLAGAYAATVTRRRALAGLALGAQLFKPQFALPLLGLLLLRGELVTVGVAALVAGAEYALGAAYCGADWPLRMVAAVRGYYRAAERRANGHKHVALPEVLDYSLGGPLQERGLRWAGPLARATGLALVAALFAYLVWRWRRADVSRADFGVYWGLAVALSTVASLHAHHYETALLALPALLLLDHHVTHGHEVSPATRLALALAYLFTPFIALLQVSRALRFQPLVLLPLGVAWWAARALRARARA